MATSSFGSVQEKVLAYAAAQKLALKDYKEFWLKESKDLYWQQKPHTIHDGKFMDGQWFLGGKLNASYNCLDRHCLAGRGDHVAIVFENEQGELRKLTYFELLKLTKDIAAILCERGIKPHDRVAIYMPMVPEAVASMLACARLGAVHTVIFGGFSKEALADRIYDAKAEAIITFEQTQRKAQPLLLRTVVDEALKDGRTSTVKTVLSFGLDITAQQGRLIAFRPQEIFPERVENPEGFDAEHPLFILYTSGTTGKPKGIFHSTGGYLTQVTSTTKWVFDLRDQDLYWCTADVGWITGHSYVTYGPLALGKSIFIYDGALNWPDTSRFYQLIDKHAISVLYTAPTAIRMFMRAGEETSHDLSSLRLLGSVGEPINPEAWHWYRRVFGADRCEIIDSWWQTETGAIMISPIEHISRQKPGSASTPFLGIHAQVVNEDGQKVLPKQTGFLVIKHPWPSMARGIWGDQERFYQTYFKRFPGVYFTGDGASVDAEGDFTIGGRIDDVVNVSGHRLGTAEIESALVAHKSVAEAAVIGIPDDITGQRLVAFVLLMNDASPSDELNRDLKEHVKNAIGSFAKPSEIHFARSLPKTRSGKIMRRLLRAKALGEPVSDLSTLDDATI
jgi:acetyl-CoA synthetase